MERFLTLTVDALMPRPSQKIREKNFQDQTVRIYSFCPPEQIAAFSLAETFREYPRYHPIISKIDSLVKPARKLDNNVTLACDQKDRIIGFGILKYPPREERWHRVGEKIAMEVSVIEVSRDWRSFRIARDIMDLLLDHPLREEKIFYMVGYSWTWDLEGTGLDVMEYRDTLIRLFSRYDFQIFQTNDPNVMMRPENLFMARIGENIPEETQKRFKMVCFNLDL